MNNNKPKRKANKFINSEAGSLWRFVPPKLSGKWGEIIKTDYMPLLLIGLDQNDTIEKELEANESFFVIDIKFPILNLKEELALENQLAGKEEEKINYYDKVMATITPTEETATPTEETKVGWIFRDEANLLIPYEENYEK